MKSSGETARRIWSVLPPHGVPRCLRTLVDVELRPRAEIEMPSVNMQGQCSCRRVVRNAVDGARRHCKNLAYLNDLLADPFELGVPGTQSVVHAPPEYIPLRTVHSSDYGPSPVVVWRGLATREPANSDDCQRVVGLFMEEMHAVALLFQ